MSEKAPDLTIVMPTYKEAGNIGSLTERIFRATASASISAEVIFFDDDSQDGTEAIYNALAQKYNVRLISRKGVRRPATAVIEGMKEAKGRFLLSMDGDLSHPPEVIPEIYRALTDGADFVLGSRYVAGDAVERGWGFHRWLNSKVATLLVRPLTSVADPLSGFFALPRAVFLKAPELSPVGYKVALELLVKSQPRNIVEVPIQFEDRKFGKGIPSLRVQIEYLKHLRRLYRYRYPFLAELVQFLFVGGLGFLVDVGIYSGMQFLLGINHLVARSFSFICAATHNWFLNRHYTFRYGQHRRPLPQWASYLCAMTAGFLLSVGTYAVLTTRTETFSNRRYSALIIGIALAAALNFLAASRCIFTMQSQKLTAKAGKSTIR